MAYRVLVADSVPVDRQTIIYFMRQSHYAASVEIRESGNAADTLHDSISYKPDILVVNAMMRDENLTGMEAAESISRLYPKCRIIFTMDTPDYMLAVRALQLGALDLIDKPVVEDRLLNALRKAIHELDFQKKSLEENLRMHQALRFTRSRVVYKMTHGKWDEETKAFEKLIDVKDTYAGIVALGKADHNFSNEEHERMDLLLRTELPRQHCDGVGDMKGNVFIIMVFSPSPVLLKNLSLTVHKVMDELLKGRKYWMEEAEFQNIQGMEAASVKANDRLAKKGIGAVEENWHKTPDGVQLVRDYIEEHYDENIRLETIAEMTGFSNSYISRLFKQSQGISISDFLIKCRTRQACELLKEGHYSIKAISEMVGYSDPNYFTNAFKKKMGISPTEYSQKNNEKHVEKYEKV
ncbi:MAG: response regulator transcription factor [Lachnospiraceae bacterium]|nr:response regulator transcription factor [Lachnospiraceae bacterium]